MKWRFVIGLPLLCWSIRSLVMDIMGVIPIPPLTIKKDLYLVVVG